MYFIEYHSGFSCYDYFKCRLYRFSREEIFSSWLSDVDKKVIVRNLYCHSDGKTIEYNDKYINSKCIIYLNPENQEKKEKTEDKNKNTGNKLEKSNEKQFEIIKDTVINDVQKQAAKNGSIL